jgi:hypothetical protein
MTYSYRSAAGFVLAVAALHCSGPSSTSSSAVTSDDQVASSINGGSTGAFDREFTPVGYTAISASLTLPDYSAPTNGSEGEPYVYYIFTDDYGSVAMEAGVAFQHGDATLPHRWRPYLRGAGPGNDNGMQFADESHSITPGSTVTLGATFNGSVVNLKVGGLVVTSENLGGLAPSSTHAARVVSNAVSGAYNGGVLGTVGPVVFSGTTVWTPSGRSTRFDSVAGWSTTSGGKLFGTVQFPSSFITASSSGGVDTITLFPGSTPASLTQDAGSGKDGEPSSEAGSGETGPLEEAAAGDGETWESGGGDGGSDEAATEDDTDAGSDGW